MNRLKELRKEFSYTQNYVATQIETDQKNISNYETDKVPIPLDKLVKLAKLYNTTTDYILGLSNERYPVKIDPQSFEQEIKKLVELYQELPKSKRKVVLDLLICLNN